MVNGRNKGASFERQIAKELHLLLGLNFKRDIEQYRAGDHGDLICDDPSWPYVIECKRYASGASPAAAWWEQAKRAADAAGKVPVLIYKFDRRDIRVVLPLSHLMEDSNGYTIEVDLDTFAYIARENM